MSAYPHVSSAILSLEDNSAPYFTQEVDSYSLDNGQTRTDTLEFTDDDFFDTLTILVQIDGSTSLPS